MRCLCDGNMYRGADINGVSSVTTLMLDINECEIYAWEPVGNYENSIQWINPFPRKYYPGILYEKIYVEKT
jgi:hypothetical protein